MRSSELAALAGVTIRTLRHYHQIGLLDEPDRSMNGYRDYHVRHLVRVLRITRLTRLGFPLSTLPDVLDDPEAAEALFDELDRQAAAEIERLTTRRAVIAGLRSHGARPDLPPAMAAYGPALSAFANISPELARHEHEQAVLLANLLGEPESSALTDALVRTAFTPTSHELLRRLATIGPETPDDEVERVAEDMATHYRPLLDEFPHIEIPASVPPLLAAHNEHGLNRQQRRAIRLFQERMVGPDAVAPTRSRT